MKKQELKMFGKVFGTFIDSPYELDGDAWGSVFYRVNPSWQLVKFLPALEKYKTVYISFNYISGDIMIYDNPEDEKKVATTNVYLILACMED